MLAQRYRISFAILTIVFVPLFAMAGCTPGPDPESVSLESATEIARAQVEEEARAQADPNDTIVVVEDLSDAWDIAFVPRRVLADNTTWKGGEPHVVVVKISGEIRRVYYTR